MKNYICKKCEKENIYREAFLEWSVRDQEWLIETTGDEFFCYNCQDTVDVEEVILSHDQDM